MRGAQLERPADDTDPAARSEPPSLDAEAEAVVRSLSLAMHSRSQIRLPLLQLKSFDQYTTTHSSNVAVLAMGLAEYLGLGSREIRQFGVAGSCTISARSGSPRRFWSSPGSSPTRSAK